MKTKIYEMQQKAVLRGKFEEKKKKGVSVMEVCRVFA